VVHPARCGVHQKKMARSFDLAIQKTIRCRRLGLFC
jgi:hypothetical protein